MTVVAIAGGELLSADLGSFARAEIPGAAMAAGEHHVEMERQF
jgi:hypothetical protein